MYEIDFSPENKYLFIIGNGLNVAMGSKSTWENVLLDIYTCWNDRNYFKEDCEEFINSKMPSISKMDAMILALREQGDRQKQIKNREQKTLSSLIGKIQSIKFNSKKSKLLDFIYNKNLSILTTNFDLNIEKYLWQDAFKPKESWNAGSFYMLDRNYASNTDSGTQVWHIHGSIDKYRTILFSTTRYMRMARRITQLLNATDKSNLEGTWLKDFFTKPLIIVGLGLGPEEFLLRWLFIERLHYLKRNKISLPPSYYLYIKTKGSVEKLNEKSAFLKMVNIIPVCVEKDIFDSPVWDTDKQVIQLTEVEK